jgi:hypothetical protein
MKIPYLFTALFNPRIDLGLSGFVALTEVPALASNTFIGTVATILDTLQFTSPTKNQPICKDFYARTLNMTDPPYMSYAYHLGFMPISDPTLCDTHLNTSASCVSQMILRYDNHGLNMMESKHGKEKTDILIFMGAIVGAIQFFALFLGIFSLCSAPKLGILWSGRKMETWGLA